MHTYLVAILVGLLGGVAIGFQNPLAAQLGRRLGILEGTLIIHVGGALVAGLAVLAVPGGQLGAWRSVPWYLLWAGALGVVLIATVSYTIPRLGVASAVVLIITAQLAIAAWLDHHGYLGVAVRPFDAARAVGLLLLAGAWLVLRR